AGLPVALWIVTNPRVALFQYVFCLFIQYPVVPSAPIYLTDISAMLVIIAAFLDVVMRGHLPKNLPRLSLNYIYIILAVIICGILGCWPELLVQRVLSLLLIIVTFFALYRLIPRVQIARLVRWFFALALLHAVVALIPFIATGGEQRSFAFTAVLFDDQAMSALPLALALYLGAKEKKAVLYLIGAIVLFLGLIATQSRAPIILALAACLFVTATAYHYSRRFTTDKVFAQTIKQKLRRLILLAAAALVGLFVLSQGLLGSVLTRFEQMLASRPDVSTAHRVVLWKLAVTAFADHPILGVGPGAFPRLHRIYPEVHLTEHYHGIRGLSAHNLFLHYLAETGIVGGIGIIALVVNLFRLARRRWIHRGKLPPDIALALYGWAFLFGLSTFAEAGWMWGGLKFLAVFFSALIARQYAAKSSTTDTP
ncbi:MAG: O-antigen ligase family protein, partial [Candidatus Zixiibacteriota bacterium]